MPEKITVFFADDHLALRDALAMLIDTFDDCRMIGVAANGIGVVDAFKKGIVPDVLLLDLTMPEMDGFETTAWVKKNFPSVNILIFSRIESEFAFTRLMKAGAVGMITKDADVNKLHEAISTLAKGGYYYLDSGGNIADIYYAAEGQKSMLEKYALKDKEIEFLKLCVSDLAYKEIGAKMGISQRAAEVIREGLGERLGLKSRPSLVYFAVKHGIASY